jgi:hypothetical protein
MPNVLLDKSLDQPLKKSYLIRNTDSEEREKQLLSQKIHYPSLR